MRIIVGVLVLVAVAGVATWHYGHDRLSGAADFRTVPVMRGELFVGVNATGTVEPVEIIDVGAQIVASVQSFGTDPDHPEKTIDFRSRVKKGDLLAQLDDLPHRAELERSRVNVQYAEADLKNCQARKKMTERALNRAKQLRETDAAADYEKAEAEDEMATAEVAMAEARLGQAQIAMKQAEINLGYTKICAPVDGVIIDRRVNVGQTVVAGMNAPSLFLLARDLGRMHVWAAVNEADIGDVSVGQTVTFTVDAYRDRTFTGKVSQIRLNASLQQNVVTYGVIVDVENPDGKLLPYMTAKVQFEIARRKDAVLVPNQAFRWRPTWNQVSRAARSELKRPKETEDQRAGPASPSGEVQEPKVDLGTPTVWVIAEDGLVRPVPVKIGLSDGMVTEVVSGKVGPGDAVVAGAVDKQEPDFVSSFVDKVTETGG